MKFYKISEKDLLELLVYAYQYQALECGGVDNWDWFGESMKDFIENCSFDDGVEYKDIESIAEAGLKYYEEII